MMLGVRDVRRGVQCRRLVPERIDQTLEPVESVLFRRSRLLFCPCPAPGQYESPQHRAAEHTLETLLEFWKVSPDVMRRGIAFVVEGLEKGDRDLLQGDITEAINCAGLAVPEPEDEPGMQELLF